MGDQIVAHVGAEGEDVSHSVERLAFCLFKRIERAFGVLRRVNMMTARECPGVIAVEIVLQAVAAVGQQIERAGMQHVGRARAAVPARRPARRAARRVVRLRSICSLLTGRPRPASMSRRAMPSLAALPRCGCSSLTVTPRRSSPDATLAGAPDHVRSSRGLPNTEVIAMWSKRGVRRRPGGSASMRRNKHCRGVQSPVINLWRAGALSPEKSDTN